MFLATLNTGLYIDCKAEKLWTAQVSSAYHRHESPHTTGVTAACAPCQINPAVKQPSCSLSNIENRGMTFTPECRPRPRFESTCYPEVIDI